MARSDLFHTVAGMPPREGNQFFSLISGLEDSRHFPALLDEAANPVIQYSQTALSDSGFPAPATLDTREACLEIRGEIAYQDLPFHLESIRAVGNSRGLKMRINSGGGDTITALKICEALDGLNVEAVVTRKAISSACTILQAATHRKIYADARVMVHQSRAATFGTAQELRTQADQLDTLVSKVKALFHRSPPNLVEKWFHSGDHWFTAQQALEAGLVDEIIPTPETAQASPLTQPLPLPAPAAPVEIDIDADALKLATEMLSRLRGTFNDQTRFNELLENFQK